MTLDEARAHVDEKAYTQDEPGECWATRDGQRETHDRRACEHFLPFREICVCGEPRDAHDGGVGICDDCDCNAFRSPVDEEGSDLD